MKLLHVSDLHIGKRIRGFSLLEDQKFTLSQIIYVIKENDIKGIIIAGDIYDNSNPTNDAVKCFDDFISKLHELNVCCYIVSGNHDNIYRVSFGSDIMAKENIYFAKKYSGLIEPIEAEKDVCIWLLPFTRPADVRIYHPDFQIGSYEEMMQTVIKNLKIDKNKINILVAHQFITCSGKAPETSDSETTSLGTLDNIDFSNFSQFDYVALGHIHKPQIMGRNTVRYAGSPLKYSFSEKNDKKSMVLLDVKEKDIKIDLIPYKPIRDMKEFEGTYDELIKHERIEDFVKIVLKDENYIADIKNKLENIFPNIMEIVYDNAYTRENKIIEKAKILEKSTPYQLFEDFFELQNNKALDDKQSKLIKEVFNDLEGIS